MKRGSARYPCPWCFWLLMVSLHIVIITAYRSTTQENEQTASSGGLVPDLYTLLPFRPQMQLHATCTVIEWERGTETTWTSDHTVCQSTEVQFDFVVGPMKLPQLARNGPLYVSCLRFTKLTCFLYSLQTHLLTNWRAPIKRWRWHDWRRQHIPFMLVSSKEQPRAVQPSDSSAFSGESQNKYDMTLVTSTCDLCVKRFRHCCGRPVHSVPGAFLEARFG